MLIGTTLGFPRCHCKKISQSKGVPIRENEYFSRESVRENTQLYWCYWHKPRQTCTVLVVQEGPTMHTSESTRGMHSFIRITWPAISTPAWLEWDRWRGRVTSPTDTAFFHSLINVWSPTQCPLLDFSSFVYTPGIFIKNELDKLLHIPWKTEWLIILLNQ